MKNPSNNSIDANLRQIVYLFAIRNGGVKEWEFLRNKLREEKNDLEKEKMNTALKLTKDENLLNQYLNETLVISLRFEGLPHVYRTITSPERKMAFQLLDSSVFENDYGFLKGETPMKFLLERDAMWARENFSDWLNRQIE